MAKRGVSGQPIDYVASGNWPHATFAGDPGARHAAAVVQLTAQALRSAMDERQLTNAALAERAGLHPGAVGRLLAGRSWPEVVTVLKLEQALGAPLFPSWNQRQA